MMKCENGESFDIRVKDHAWIQDHSPPIRIKAVRKEAKHSSKDPPRAEYYCRKCKAHNITKPVKKHKRVCPFIRCACNKCRLVDEGRRVVAQQIAIYRDQKSNGADPVSPVKLPSLTNAKRQVSFTAMSMVEKTFDCLDGSGSSPHCRRCRNHQIVVTWKGHKKICPYRGCLCEKCTLINKRKDTEKNLRDLITQKEEGRLPLKHEVYHHYVNHPTPSKFVPSFGTPPGAPPTGLYPSSYHPQMATISHYPSSEGPAHLYNHLSMLSGSVPPAYSTSGSSDSPGFMDRIGQSGNGAPMPSPALLAASQHMANLTAATGSSAFSNTLKGFNSPTQSNYEMISGDFKPHQSLSFSHSPPANAYSRYTWNGLYPNPNPPTENRISANYQHNPTYSNYFSSLQLTPPVPVNSDTSSNPLTYRSLANYCY